MLKFAEAFVDMRFKNENGKSHFTLQNIRSIM